LKVGCFKLKIVEKLQQPSWYKDTKTKRKVQLQFAILCAKEVLHIFEKRYPNDLRPRKAIEVAEEVLKSSFKDKSAAAAVYADVVDIDADYAYVACVDAVACAYAADADVVRAARAAAHAVACAYAAANANAYVAAYVADAVAANKNIDFNKLANKAVELQGETF
jgi:hypothetical protein